MTASQGMLLASIAIGGAMGSLLRFVLGGWLSRLATPWFAEMTFPLATFVVNLLGSFCIGIAFVAFEHGIRDPVFRELFRGFLIVGLLGGFTTFSTFSLETIQLMLSGFWGRAMFNIIASVAICVTAARAGLGAGRWLMHT